MALPKLKKNPHGYFGGGIVNVLDDMNLTFTGDLLEEMRRYHNIGYSFEEIGECFNRDPDEVFVALFHLARQDGNIRPVGRRFI